MTQAISSGNEENLRYLLGEFGLHCGARHLAAKNFQIYAKRILIIKQLDQIFGYERDLSIAMMKIDNEGLSLSKIEDLVDTQLVQKSATIQLWILNQREGGNSYSSSFLFSEELMGCVEMSLNLRENLELFKEWSLFIYEKNSSGFHRSVFVFLLYFRRNRNYNEDALKELSQENIEDLHIVNQGMMFLTGNGVKRSLRSFQIIFLVG